MNRRCFLAAVALSATLAGAPSAFAIDQKYDQKVFDAAQAAGRPILVEVSAPWCPTCKAQAPILSRLKADPRFKQLASFTIDFDTQKDLLRRFNVQRQSTLIVFKGKREAGRSTGDTNPASIEQLLAKSI